MVSPNSVYNQSVPLTLGIQEVLNGYIMRTISINGGVSEDVLGRTSHGLLGVFVAESLHMVTNVGSALPLKSAAASSESG